MHGVMVADRPEVGTITALTPPPLTKSRTDSQLPLASTCAGLKPQELPGLTVKGAAVTLLAALLTTRAVTVRDVEALLVIWILAEATKLPLLPMPPQVSELEAAASAAMRVGEGAGGNPG
jgi:hypothetical protein